MTTKTKLPVPPGDAEDVYHLYLLRYARAADRTAHGNFQFRDMHDGPMPVDYNLWIATNARRTILVDTGFSARAAAERHRRLDFDPVKALAQLGVDPEGLEDIILTHLHFDHAGNIDRFGKARFHVQDRELVFATGRCMCGGFLRHPFDVEDVVALVRRTYAERVRFHDGDAAPFPGISLHLLPGHSKGLQAVRVMTPRGPVILASDICHFYAFLTRGSPSVVTVDMPATMRSYRSLVALAGGDYGRIIPGHDPKVRRFFPQIEVEGFELTALHEAPPLLTAEMLARLDDF